MDIKIGKHYRREPSRGQHGMVGKLVGIEGDKAVLEGHSRYGQSPRREVPSDELIQVCGKHMWSGYDHRVCGRPVKEGDLCGIHAGAEKRSRTNAAKAKAEADARARQRDHEATLRAEADGELRAAGVEYHYLTAAGGLVKVTMTMDQVRGLVNR